MEEIAFRSLKPECKIEFIDLFVHLAELGGCCSNFPNRPPRWLRNCVCLYCTAKDIFIWTYCTYWYF